jgi:hypothetical protein
VPVESSASAEPETPEEFVRRWVDADTHMQNTGDADEYRRMSSRCKSCKAYAKRIESIYAAGGYVRTDGWRIDALKVADPTPAGEVDVTISIHAPPTQYIEQAGGQVQHFKGGDAEYIISITKIEESWSTIRFAQVAQ